MRYVFLAIGMVAAAVLWVQKSGDKEEFRRQVAAVPGYSINPQ